MSLIIIALELGAMYCGFQALAPASTGSPHEATHRRERLSPVASAKNLHEDAD